MKISTSTRRSRQPRSGLALAIATVIAILATIMINALSNFFPPGGQNIGAIANTILRGVQITPANYAFAIWGVIYLGLIAYSIYQLYPSQRTDPRIQRVDKLLIVASLAQIAWVYLFTLQQFWSSVLAMLVILVALIAAYLQLKIGKAAGSHAPASSHRVSHDRQWMAQIPISIYLSWISVATIVNIASALYKSQWDGWGISAAGWTGIMLVIGAGLAALVTLQRADIPFILVFVWAYVAIAIRQSTAPLISITALVLAIALTLLILLRRMGHFRSHSH